MMINTLPILEAFILSDRAQSDPRYKALTLEDKYIYLFCLMELNRGRYVAPEQMRKELEQDRQEYLKMIREEETA